MELAQAGVDVEYVTFTEILARNRDGSEYNEWRLDPLEESQLQPIEGGRKLKSERVYPRHIRFSDLVNMVQIDPDYHVDGCPFTDTDCFPHELRRDPMPEEQMDYRYGCTYVGGRGRRAVIEVWDKHIESIQGKPPHGASKQVKAEWYAWHKKALIDEINGWYRNGWTSYVIFLAIFDGQEIIASDSLGSGAVRVDEGIDKDWEQELRRHVAGEVACELEKKGFVIVDDQGTQSRSAIEIKAENRKRMAEHLLNSQNWGHETVVCRSKAWRKHHQRKMKELTQQ